MRRKRTVGPARILAALTMLMPVGILAPDWGQNPRATNVGVPASVLILKPD